MPTRVTSKPKRVYQIWLEQSVLSSHVNSYIRYLSTHGYSANTISFYLNSVAHFSHWLTKEKMELRRIDEKLIHRFVTVHLPACDCPERCNHQVDNALASLRHLIIVLRSKGYIPPRVGSVPRAVQEEIDRFDRYLDGVCGLASKTRVVRLCYARKFLSSVFKPLVLRHVILLPVASLAVLPRHAPRPPERFFAFLIRFSFHVFNARETPGAKRREQLRVRKR